LMPSVERQTVQNSPFGTGVGERPCKTVCKDFGDVDIASNV
jgi:hypothetical protein